MNRIFKEYISLSGESDDIYYKGNYTALKQILKIYIFKEVNPYWKVDPDGSIARKTYFESYLGQLKDMEDTIKSYYADAYEEAVSAPINSLAFISGKYLCDWSDYYAPNIPKQERQWTHHQLWAMLTDSNVALNDPYALASSGGTKTVDEIDKIAKQAVKDKLDLLIKEHETSKSN